jgi:cation transport regulator ChaB
MKTAMQELIDEIKEAVPYFKMDIYQENFNKALEKEKEQIMKAYEDAHDMTYNSCESGCMGQMILEVSKEQYYNQTYNQN